MLSTTRRTPVTTPAPGVIPNTTNGPVSQEPMAWLYTVPPSLPGNMNQNFVKTGAVYNYLKNPQTVTLNVPEMTERLKLV